MNLIRVASMLSGGVLLWVALAMPAVAQEEAPPDPIHVGPGVMAANLIKQVKPKYPEWARAAGVYGKVVLSVVVDEGGYVVKATPESGPHSLYEAAVEAVKQWEYRPVIYDKQPVPVTFMVEVAFHLDE